MNFLCFMLTSVGEAFVPRFMQRPLAAVEARRPFPLMAAAWTAPAGLERIPRRAARVKERLWRIHPVAGPPARRRGPPSTQRTADTAQRRVVFNAGCVDRASIDGAITFQKEFPAHAAILPDVQLHARKRGRAGAVVDDVDLAGVQTRLERR